MKNSILKDKTCLITGASRGLGKSLAQQLAKIGCNLILTSRNHSKLEEIKNELKLLKNGIRIKIITGEIENENDIIRIANEAVNSSNSVDILINNAGVFPVKKITDSNIQDFNYCFNVNVRAPFYLIRELSPNMIKNKWGRIVNIGSSSSYAGFSETSIYCASKHALLGLSRSVFQEMKEHNVRNIFALGSMQTDMGKLVQKQNFDTFIDPNEISKLICKLITYDGNMITEEIRFNRTFI